MPQNELSPDELIPVITQIFLESANNRSPEIHIQKILFELKTQLPDEAELQRILPFYWYRLGPYSEPVASALKVMRSKGILTRDKKVLILNLKKVTRPIIKQNIVNKIKEILSSFKFYKFNDFLRQIYYSYKPYEFIPLFKIDFMETLELYIANIRQKDLGQFLDPPTFNYLDKMENVLYKCEENIPSNPLFDEFKDLFTSFMIDAITIFDYSKDFGSNRDIYSKILVKAKYIWFAFVDGVKIQPKAHDLYYESNLKEWHNDYCINMNKLRLELAFFTLDAIDNVSYDSSPDFQDEKSRKIITAVIGEYPYLP